LRWCSFATRLWGLFVSVAHLGASVELVQRLGFTCRTGFAEKLRELEDYKH